MRVITHGQHYSGRRDVAHRTEDRVTLINLSSEQQSVSLASSPTDYVMSPTERDELAALLDRRYGADLARCRQLGHKGLVIAVQGTDPLAKLGRALEQRVFDAKAGNHSPEVMVQEYGEYEPQSSFFLAVDSSTGEITAVLRLLIGVSGIGTPVKTIRDTLRRASYRESFEAEVIDITDNSVSLEAGVVGYSSSAGARLNRSTVETFHGMAPGELVADIATVAVSPDCRGADAGLLWVPLLVAAAFRAMAALRLKHAVTFVQEDFLRAMREHYQVAWVDLCGLGPTQYVPGDPYLSQPVYLDVASTWRNAAASSIDREIKRPGKNNRLYDRLTKLMVLPSDDGRFVLHGGREPYFS